MGDWTQVIVASAILILLLIVGVIYYATMGSTVCASRCAPSVFVEVRDDGLCLCVDDQGRLHAAP